MSQATIGAPPPPALRQRRFRLRMAEAPITGWAKARERLAWVLVRPAILAVVGVAIYPLLRTCQYSFTNAYLGSNEFEYVGLRNYQRLWESSLFRDTIVHTLIFTVVAVYFETVLGMIIALTIHSNFKGRGAVRTSMLIPWAIPTVVSAQMWAWMYNDVFGVVNDFLVKRIHLLDKPIAWAADPDTALWAIIAVDIWKTTPFMALLLLAGLQVIPGDVYEAATVDGASKWKQFWQMTLPLVRPALLVALIFRSLDTFKVFDVVQVMTAYSPDTMTVAVFSQQQLTKRASGVGMSSASSVVILAFILVMVVIYTRMIKVEES
jgi:trehalose/maltose transport system permease protein